MNYEDSRCKLPETRKTLLLPLDTSNNYWEVLSRNINFWCELDFPQEDKQHCSFYYHYLLLLQCSQGMKLPNIFFAHSDFKYYSYHAYCVHKHLNFEFEKEMFMSFLCFYCNYSFFKKII